MDEDYTTREKVKKEDDDDNDDAAADAGREIISLIENSVSQNTYSSSVC